MRNTYIETSIKITMKFLTLFLVCLLAAGCALHDEADLAGNWQTVSITEEGDSLAVDLNNINFRFTDKGRYTYNSTLEYHESGRYHIDGKYLLSIDTTQAGQTEKAVEIMQLANDSLILRMKDQEKERLLVLVRE